MYFIVPVSLLKKLEKEARLVANLSEIEKTEARVWSGKEELPLFVGEIKKRDNGK